MTVFMDAVIASGGEGHDLERTIDRFADAVAGSIGGGVGARAHLAAAPGGVSFARVLEGVTRDRASRPGSRHSSRGATSRLAAITGAGQNADAIRKDVDPTQTGGLLVLVALGIMVALDVGLPFAPEALRDTVLRLLAKPN
jgi:hypothetical protein